MGCEIPQVAEKLRIRQPFIEALEDGRHRDLPGGTYAIGFLRSYAEFLGLDGEEMVRRFKQEAAGDLSAHSELQFPSPVSEGRMPTAPVLLIGLVLAVAAYGLWWSLGTKHESLSELVPDVPQRLASLLHRPAGVTQSGSEQGPSATAPSEQAAPQGAESAAPADANPAAVPGATPATTEASPQTTPAPAAPQANLAPAAPQANPAPAAPQSTAAPVQPTAPAPVAQQPAPAAPQAPTPAPQPELKSVTTTEAPAAAASSATVAQTEAAKPSADTQGARVVLRAVKDDCWIQVRESDGQLVTSRLLHRGDSYAVPDRPGLTLTAGNAGALNIVVDGQDIGPLETSKKVRRDVNLDPAKLRK